MFPSGWTCLGQIQHLADDAEGYWFGDIAAMNRLALRQTMMPVSSHGRLRPLPRGDLRASAIMTATPLDILALCRGQVISNACPKVALFGVWSGRTAMVEGLKNRRFKLYREPPTAISLRLSTLAEN